MPPTRRTTSLLALTLTCAALELACAPIDPDPDGPDALEAGGPDTAADTASDASGPGADPDGGDPPDGATDIDAASDGDAPNDANDDAVHDADPPDAADGDGGADAPDGFRDATDEPVDAALDSPGDAIDDTVPDTDPADAPDLEPDVERDPAVVCARRAPSFALETPEDWRFVEVAEASGISGMQWADTHLSFTDSPCGESSILTGGAAVEDFDGDGHLDVFLPRLHQPDQLYRNRGDGTFEDVAPALGIASTASGNAAAWVDIDEDGDLDLFVANLAGEPNHLWIQTDDGPWRDEAALRGVAMAAPGDRADGCGNVFGVSFADVDGDLDLDLYVSRWIPGRTPWASRLYRNVGRGFFVDDSLAAGLVPEGNRSVVFGSSWFDFDGDGDLDGLLTADFGTSRYYRNEGGRFVLATAESGLGTDENGMGVAVADLDGDGDLDAFVTSIYSDVAGDCVLSWGCTGNRMYLNRGNGTFFDCTDEYGVRDGGWGWGAAAFDADLDGDLDLAQTGGYWLHWDHPALDFFRAALGSFRFGGMRLWLAGDDGAWRESSASLGLVSAQRGRALVAFDADGDGDEELLLVHNIEAPMLFRNDGPEGRSWLSVRLRDRAPNTYAIGATVLLTAVAGGPTARRDIAASGSFLSTRPFEARFGLGDHEGAVHELRVIWPDGRRTTHRGVPAMGTVTLTRPDP